MEETFYCRRCGEEFSVSQCTEFDGAELCQRCLNETTVICAHCGTLFRAEDNQNTDACPICPDCRKRYYGPCVQCGTLVLLDAEYTMYDDDDQEKSRPWCEDCFWTHYDQLHPEEAETWLKRRTLPGQIALSPAFQTWDQQ